jgi:hypothetical protein
MDPWRRTLNLATPMKRIPKAATSLAGPRPGPPAAVHVACADYNGTHNAAVAEVQAGTGRSASADRLLQDPVSP